MPKGYWIGHVDVRDMAGYQGYIAANAAVFARYGARFMVRGGRRVVKEGACRARTVVIEFKDYATALACYESADYADVMTRRTPFSVADLMIIEGYDEVCDYPLG